MLVQDYVSGPNLLRELTASQLAAIATHSDTGSRNRLNLIQSLVPTYYVCNGYTHHVDKGHSLFQIIHTCVPLFYIK